MSHIDYKVLSRVTIPELKKYVKVTKLSQTPVLERSIAVFNVRAMRGPTIRPEISELIQLGAVHDSPKDHGPRASRRYNEIRQRRQGWWTYPVPDHPI
jgi:hypothetical protein